MNNILLIQFRKDSSVFHERDCFLRYFQKEKNLKLKILDAFNRKTDFSHPQKLLKNSCGVILGGSAEFYFSKNTTPEKEKCFREMLKRITPFVKYLLKKDFPTLGICFGHQMLGYFLGSKIINDKNQAESGSFLVFLTKEGEKTSLFKDIPQKFFAQFGHRDSLKSLPKETKLLAKTKKCKISAFRYKSKIYGVQFHPELTKKDMIFRLKLFPQYKLKGLKLKSTPFSSKIIKNFLKITNDKILC